MAGFKKRPGFRYKYERCQNFVFFFQVHAAFPKIFRLIGVKAILHSKKSVILHRNFHKQNLIYLFTILFFQIMKNLFAYFALCLTVAFGLAVSSCSVDLCKDVDCGANGSCDSGDGKCKCITGYETDATSGKCDVVSRAKFLGTYQEVDQCSVPATGSPFTNTVTITESSTGINKVLLNGYAGYPGLNAVATISESTINVEAGDYTANSHTYKVYATSSTLVSGKFTLTFKVDQDGTVDSDCIGVYTKQ